MKKYDANNERIKKDYFKYQKEANQRSGLTVDEIRKSIARYEEYISYKDFRTFNKEQATGFKKHLTKQKNIRTGGVISKSTMVHIMNDLKTFFKWLAYQKGYKSKIDIYENCTLPTELRWRGARVRRSTTASSPCTSRRAAALIDRNRLDDSLQPEKNHDRY